MSRDFQKTKVYKWEDQFVRPRDTAKVNFQAATAIVQYVWEREGLKFPPLVEQFDLRTKTKMGDSTRMCIRLMPNAYTWLVLHELAHSLNTDINGHGDRHGPNYLGIYIRLLANYGNHALPLLLYTATKAGLKFDLNARYAVLDTIT